MYAIRNYTNTKCELEMAKTRLSLLMDRKEKLYCKYFPISSKIKEVMVDGGSKLNNKMADYVAELHEVDIGTGKSLAEEIEFEQENISKLQSYIDEMNNTLSKMSGIEYQLFYEIIFKGIKINKAVNNIANLNSMDSRSIWRHYYKNIKDDIKKIKNFTQCH